MANRELETAIAHLENLPDEVLPRLARLWLARQAVMAADRALRAEIEELDETAQSMLLTIGATRGLKLDDPPVTLRVSSELWAGVDKREGESTDEAYARACDALRAAGMGDFPRERFDTRSLSAHFRELAREDEGFELPAPLDGAIKLTEKMKVRVTRT